jgi:PAS domain-containing protein
LVTVIEKKALLYAVQTHPSLLKHDSTKHRISGLLMIHSKPFMIASHPIVTSNFNGPIRGSLVMGRVLDDEEVQQISKVTQSPLNIHPVETPPPALTARHLHDDLLNAPNALTLPLSAESIAGYALFNDLTGVPALIMESTMERKIFRYGYFTWRTNALAMLSLGLLLMLLLLFLLDHAILRRLSNLTTQVNQIAQDDQRSTRIAINRNDEIGQLALGINTMLESLHRTHAQQIEGEMQYRAVVEDQNELICRMDQQGVLTFVNGAFCRFFNRASSDLINRRFFQLPHHFQFLIASVIIPAAIWAALISCGNRWKMPPEPGAGFNGVCDACPG